MASSVSGISSYGSLYPTVSDSSTTTGQAQEPKQTATLQMQALQSEGESATQIAASLGVSVTEVDEDLGLTTTSNSTPVISISVKA